MIEDNCCVTRFIFQTKLLTWNMTPRFRLFCKQEVRVCELHSAQQTFLRLQQPFSTEKEGLNKMNVVLVIEKGSSSNVLWSTIGNLPCYSSIGGTVVLIVWALNVTNNIVQKIIQQSWFTRIKILKHWYVIDLHYSRRLPVIRKRNWRCRRSIEP